MTKSMSHGPTKTGLSREEFAVMAELSHQEGHLAEQESMLLKNMMRFHDQPVTNAMTPRTVVFSVAEHMSIDDYFTHHNETPFTRIPLHRERPEDIIGFVMRSDLLLAKARGENEVTIQNFKRDIVAIPETTTLPRALNDLLKQRSHIMLIVNEYGDVAGIITLEDILETLLGLEFVDEHDRSVDMQKLARRLWEQRAKEKGLQIEIDQPST